MIAIDPNAHHYFMPAEWMPHRGTILTWPHRPAIWRGLHAQVEVTFAQLIKELSEVEEVHVNVPNLAVRDHAAALSRQAGAEMAKVFWHLIDSDDVWARDHGPIAVVRKPDAPRHLPPLVLLDWIFNAWGGKFESSLDNEVPRQLARDLGLPVVSPGLVMEGGSLEVNGIGDLLTTEAVLLRDNRNPGFAQRDIEASLRAHLGCDRLHWLGHGLEGDDTDGHIDDIARFVNETTLVVVGCGKPDHPDHAIMAENHARLAAMRSRSGQPFEVAPLPVPEPILYAGEHLPASYANFYLANGKLLLPTFGQPSDAEATAILASLLPSHRIVGIDGRALVSQYGNIHCVTQQIPQAPE